MAGKSLSLRKNNDRDRTVRNCGNWDRKYWTGVRPTPLFLQNHVRSKRYTKFSFHAKIKTEYHQYTIRQVNKKSLNLACSFRKCKAKATVKISPDLILPGAEKLRNNKIRSTFKVDFSNPRMRELSNYDVIPNSSPSHCHPGVKSDMFNPVSLCEFATRFGTYDSTNIPEIPTNLTSL